MSTVTSRVCETTKVKHDWKLMKMPMYMVSITALLFAIAVPHSASAQPGGSRQQLEEMFSNISRKTAWNMSRDMLWGYYFTNPSPQPLEIASKDLARSGYRVVAIYLREKKSPRDPDLWWLHVERVETHSVASLLQRNAELALFAKSHALNTYDGMDVGPANATKK